MSRKVGRPSKLTEHVKERLVEALQKGAYKDDACHYAGIHKSTFYRWFEKGEAQNTGEFRDFCDVIRRAEAEGIMVDLSTIYEAVKKGDWRAAAWKLEHKEPAKYGNRERRDINLNVEDTNKDVIQTRVEKFFDELKRRQIKIDTED